MSHIQEEIKRIQAELPESVRLVAVSKYHPVEALQEAYDAGQRIFGESKVQEMTQKYEVLPKDIQWHFIGHLQTNKIKYVIGEAALIQSLDTLRLAEELEKQAARRELTVPVLVEVNSGREAQKGGLMPEDVPAFCEALRGFPHLSVRGLMTMGPDCESPEGYRPYFALTRTLAEGLAAQGLLPEAPILSMGMSGSYEVAAEEGATHVRVGRTLFKNPTETA